MLSKGGGKGLSKRNLHLHFVFVVGEGGVGQNLLPILEDKGKKE